MLRTAQLCLIALVAAAGVASAAEPSPAAPNYNLVISRAVNPRVAYRGLPADRYAVKSQVGVFPAAAFDSALDSASVGQATDAMLAGTTSPIAGGARLATGALPPSGVVAPLGGWGNGAPGMAPQAGGISRMTGGVGTLIGRVVTGATGGRGP